MIHHLVSLLTEVSGHTVDTIGLPVGVAGGGLAGVIFYFYTKEREKNSQITAQVMEAFRSNTAAITELTGVIVALKERTFCPMGGEEISKFIQVVGRVVRASKED